MFSLSSIRKIENKISLEFKAVEQGKNPDTSADIEAVVVLSGESRDPAIKTKLHDTEERLTEGIRIYKEVERLGGSPTLVLNGTDTQNAFMKKESVKHGFTKIMVVKNPPFPEASTKTQILGLVKLSIKNLAIVIHAFVGPRTIRYVRKYLDDFKVKLFLIDRGKINQIQIRKEIKKIAKYASKGDIDL